MKKLLIVLLTLSVLLTGCSSNSSAPAQDQANKNPLNSDWTSIQSEAKGTTVNFYMWGGDDRINTWVDTVVANSMKKDYGIIVNRVPMGPDEYLNKLIGEKQANKQEGSIDMVWINGENFRTARQANLLWGPFADKVPNYQKYVDKTAPDIANDFGFPVEGYEVPYGKAQFVFAYDTAKVNNPPKSSLELLEWVKEHPGRFTYPELPDFTGSVFVRNLMYELCGGYQAFPYTEQVNKETLNKQLQPLWDYFGAIKGYLWRQGKTYPSSVAALDQLFADGEVDITMTYNPAIFSGRIEQGLLPDTVRTSVWNNGTIGNTHFLAIPFNAANKNGALVLADFMLSPEAQLSKYEPKNWGDLMALDLNKLDPQLIQELKGINPGIATLSTEELQTHRLPEISAAYIPVIEELWKEGVIQSGQ
ncbi:ABC transporter substrate-binding protein [Desulfosporosinus nitroreducens]|uniref:ABC transporter substrate-binding protein n=1 Tax=Desulfosporosinus nitroreducens TaxID=2018668 RepID=A0ABT8QVR5_9FIRM|nr:ABC transporter substrate-binding protein [Desulfosporosinus nitroreducens]MDO0824957.1 ABC transporter substrate-binding protein [Desulfosporosinus nitroreducens]